MIYSTVKSHWTVKSSLDLSKLPVNCQKRWCNPEEFLWEVHIMCQSFRFCLAAQFQRINSPCICCKMILSIHCIISNWFKLNGTCSFINDSEKKPNRETKHDWLASSVIKGLSVMCGGGDCATLWLKRKRRSVWFLYVLVVMRSQAVAPVIIASLSGVWVEGCADPSVPFLTDYCLV